MISLLRRAGKAYCNAYCDAHIIKLDNGHILCVNSTSGTAWIA